MSKLSVFAVDHVMVKMKEPLSCVAAMTNLVMEARTDLSLCTILNQ